MNHSASSLTSNNDSTYSDLELTTNKKTVGNKKQGNKNTRIADHVIIHNLSHEYTEINAPRMSSRPTRPSILHRTSSQTSECNTEEDSDEEQCLNRSFGNLQSKSQFRRSERGPFSWEQRQDKEFNNYHTMRRVDHRMSMSVRRGGSMYMPAQPAYLQNVETPPKKVSKSKLASIWRRLTGPPKRPQQIRREQHVEVQPPRISGLCSYGGIGLNFKRINRGDEITLVVVGASRCGKTSFIENVTIVAAQTEGYSLIGPRERLCLSKIKPKSVPHMITLKWEDVKEGQQFVVDIVEAHLSPSGRTEKELMQPYLAAADAVLIIVNSSDNATLLSALSTSNILKNRGLPHVLIKNNFEVDAMQPTFVKKVVDAIGVRFYEQSLDKPTNEILMIIQNLVQTVVDKKVGHCKIWGTQE